MANSRKGDRSKPNRVSRPKKRKYLDNLIPAENDTAPTSASAKKIRNNPSFASSCDETNTFVILAFASVFGTLSNLLKCKKCDGDIRFEKSSVVGLGFFLNVICSCSEEKVPSCPRIGRNWEINRKLFFVMRLLGIGFHGVDLFCSMMDLCRGVPTGTYYSVMEHVKIACESIYNKVISKAANEEREENRKLGRSDEELTVSGDGTWAKRGYTSLLGVVTLIGKYTGKILDLIVKCSYCHSCAVMQKKINAEEFEIWFDEHSPNCKKNHDGSAGKMEVTGVYEMFLRSLELHGVRYAEYIGDGDSKTFPYLLEKLPYGKDFIIKKLECVNHVSKRMFKRLTETRKKITAAKKMKKREESKIAAEEAKNSEKSSSSAEKAEKPTAPPDSTSTKARGRPKKLALNTAKVGPASASKSKAAKNQSKKSEAAKKPSTTPKKSPEPVEPKTNLTDKLIREMSIYFALAIQRNPESLEDMKKEVWAGFLHKISTDDHPQHDSCNIEWCNYLINTATGEPFVHPPPSTRKFKKLSKKFTLHYPMKIFLLDAWEKTIKIPTSHTTLAFGSLHQSTTTQAKTS